MTEPQSLIAVTYAYDPERPDDVAEMRPEHRSFLSTLRETGTVVASGPFADGEPGALLLVSAPDARAALDILDEDPFWKAGLIVQRDARRWTVVLGSVGRDDE